MRILLSLTALCCALPVLAFDLQGHRGARGLAPENTLPAFAMALGIGVTTLEMDVAITRDGQLVLSHNPVLNPDITRGSDSVFLTAPGPAIAQLSLDELRQFDIGRINPATRYAAQFPEQVARDGIRFPLLQDVFALVQKAGNTQVRFDIETKVSPLESEETRAPEPFARALIAAIRNGGMAHRATIQSFDWRTLQVVQKEAPEIATVYLTAQQRWLDTIGSAVATDSPWTAGFQLREHGSVPRMVKAAGGRMWSAYFGDLDAARIDEAHALGLQVLAWTVNQPKDIARLMDMGVDGIISDRPDRVRTEMARRNMELPVATPVGP